MSIIARKYSTLVINLAINDWKIYIKGVGVLIGNRQRTLEWLLESQLPVNLPPVLDIPGLNNPPLSLPNLENTTAGCN